MLAFMGLGPFELAIVGVAAVLLFGKNLPAVARSAGKSFSEFKRGMQDLQDDVRRTIDAEEYTASPPRLESPATVGRDDGAAPNGYPDPPPASEDLDDGDRSESTGDA